MSRQDADASQAYLGRLCRSLIGEYHTEGFGHPDGLDGPAEGAGTFGDALARYRKARTAIAGLLDSAFTPAAAYRSMEEFWTDAAEQEAGTSKAAFWDSYESGRRRCLESQLAKAFNAEQCVLVNAGMSALDVALRSSGLRPGDSLLIHASMYFETKDLLDALYTPWSVQLVPVDVRDADATLAALEVFEPKVALIELALNSPGCDVPVLEAFDRAQVRVIADSSALGHGFIPADVLCADRVLYIESGMKYLTREAGCGAVYGWGEWVRQARLTARRTGQQMQGRALHRLRPGEIEACRERLALHSVRRRRFVAAVGTHNPDLVVTDAATAVVGRDDRLARAVRGGADGCLAFLRFPGSPAGHHEQAHRALVACWAVHCAAPRIRAGFGWSETTGRAYGRDALNTARGESFTRLSIGIEPETVIDDLAARLVESARQVLR